MSQIENLGELTIPELETKISSLKEKLFDFRVKKSTGQLANPLSIRQMRREIARVKTILQQRKIIEATKNRNAREGEAG